MNTFDIQNLIQQISKEQNAKIEQSIMSQLNDFISRGLIVVEYGPSTLVHSLDSSKIEYKQTVTLKLKDREYIEQLEAEVKKYKQIIDIIGNK